MVLGVLEVQRSLDNMDSREPRRTEHIFPVIHVETCLARLDSL